jgi:hypothetical protein
MPHRNQAIRVRIWKRLQHDSIQNTEDPAHRAYAEAESENRDTREDSAPPEEKQ